MSEVLLALDLIEDMLGLLGAEITSFGSSGLDSSFKEEEKGIEQWVSYDNFYYALLTSVVVS